MYLLLVRHGESVDNVAGLYAGSRDSPLTNHGVLQTKRLGSHLASRRNDIGPVAHIFTSNLQRAYTTAASVAEAQHTLASSPKESEPIPVVLRLPDLREKDFGSTEGKKFGTRGDNPVNGIVQPDSESREAMMVRVNRFIDNYLVSVLEQHVSEKLAVVIVAHGIILNVLLKALMTRFPARDEPAFADGYDRPGSPEYLVSWNNTGVLQAKIEAFSDPPKPSNSNEPTIPKKEIPDVAPVVSTSTRSQIHPRRFIMSVQFTNNIDHLSGLKKTRGGIGSAKFDARQRTMTSFFTPASKKRKAEDEATG